MRAAYTYTTPQGAARWTAGQELRAALHTVPTDGTLTLTDGTHVAQVPETEVTRDMDDAAALRQMSTGNENASRARGEQDAARVRIEQEIARQQQAAQDANGHHIVSGEFHRTDLDEPARYTNRAENIVSTAGGPVIYYPGTTTVIINRTTNLVPISRRTARPPRRATLPGPRARRHPAHRGLIEGAAFPRHRRAQFF